MAFSSLVVARANGLFTLHLKKALNLVGSLKEKKYVKNESEEKIRTRRTTIPAPAGKRFIAYTLDMFFVNILATMLEGIVYFVLTSLEVELPDQAQTIGICIHFGLMIIIGGILIAGPESGIDQASIGKVNIKLYVCDEDYRHISTMQSWGRYLAMIFLSTIFTLCIGNLMALFRPDKKTLHDLLSGTQVRMDKPRKIRASDED
ncbi:MAG: RDD family protein [Planctomycetaceae bacterium]|nr:RDD family protein [Planctomycetaceae bacterium]